MHALKNFKVSWLICKVWVRFNERCQWMKAFLFFYSIYTALSCHMNESSQLHPSSWKSISKWGGEPWPKAGKMGSDCSSVTFNPFRNDLRQSFPVYIRIPFSTIHQRLTVREIVRRIATTEIYQGNELLNCFSISNIKSRGCKPHITTENDAKVTKSCSKGFPESSSIKPGWAQTTGCFQGSRVCEEWNCDWTGNRIYSCICSGQNWWIIERGKVKGHCGCTHVDQNLWASQE